MWFHYQEIWLYYQKKQVLQSKMCVYTSGKYAFTSKNDKNQSLLVFNATINVFNSGKTFALVRILVSTVKKYKFPLAQRSVLENQPLYNNELCLTQWKYYRILCRKICLRYFKHVLFSGNDKQSHYYNHRCMHQWEIYVSASGKIVSTGTNICLNQWEDWYILLGNQSLIVINNVSAARYISVFITEMTNVSTSAKMFWLVLKVVSFTEFLLGNICL